MRDLMNKMNKHRVEDKVAFKNSKNDLTNNKKGLNDIDRESSPQKINNGTNNSGPRPVSEPGGVNKKSINYRIKNKVIKR